MLLIKINQIEVNEMKKRHELVSQKTLNLISKVILQQPGVTSKNLAVQVGLSERTVRAATKQLVLQGQIVKKKSLQDLRHSHFFSASQIPIKNTTSLSGVASA